MGVVFVTDIIFSFDVEDYINPAGADAVLRRRIGYCDARRMADQL